MKEINHTMQLSAATMLMMLLGSYLYSSSVDVNELRYLSTVNADIHLNEHAEIGGAETTNGDIQTRRNVHVHHSLSTVNGDIQTSPGTVVEEQLSTVNGDITLHGTRIGHKVKTSNGDISLIRGSVVEGDVIVNGRLSWLERLFFFKRQPTNLFIDADSSVMGDIHLYRTANLSIAEGAKIGEIIKHY